MALKLACIGGGSGLSALLSGIKHHADLEIGKDNIVDLDSLAAIVTVSDDGGSSGRLVEEFDMLPPGDIRRLLFTLSDADELAGLFEHRFSSNGELGGHTVGNLLLTALTEKFEGNFPKAIQAASRLLAVRGTDYSGYIGLYCLMRGTRRWRDCSRRIYYTSERESGTDQARLF